MVDNEYEILPHQLLNDLRYDVEALKKKLTEPDAKANELILEIESLKDSIHELTVIFQKALSETKEEDVTKTIKSLSEKLEAVTTQNETIARGMVAISDKLEEFMKRSAPSLRMSSAPLPSLISTSSGSMMNDLPPPPNREMLNKKRKLNLF